MKLTRLEIEGYRSVRDQTGSDAIEFDGLDCLVGKNNAGKTNILCAVLLLLDNSPKNTDEELFWNMDTDQTVEIRAFFDVSDDDLDRITDPDDRNILEQNLIDVHGHEGMLGLCIEATNDDGVSTNRRLLKWLPVDEHWSREGVIERRDKLWDQQKSGEITKTEYAETLEEEFPPIADRIPQSKRRNKGIWTTTYHEYIDTHPEELEFEIQPTTFGDVDQSVVFDALLPRVIHIPASREIESATQRGGVFGNLIDEISEGIQDDLDRELESRLSDFDPGEHEAVKAVESRLTEHLKTTFGNQAVGFRFPTISTDYIFKNADIRIDEEDLSDLSKENVGQGVKRTVIFSLLRTIAEIRDGILPPEDPNGTIATNRPLLITFEESELFLHPALQIRLLSAFRDLRETDVQIIFSTHSPMLIEHQILDTIHLVRKVDRETTVTQFHTILEDEDPVDRSRLTELPSVSSYIFADRVLLVEGTSDYIVINKLAKRFHEDWNFDIRDVTLLNAGGKGDVCRYYRFLQQLGIETFAIVDIDACRSELETILDESDPAWEKLRRFQEVVDDRFTGPHYDPEGLETAIRTMPWETGFERLEDLADRLRLDMDTNPDDHEIIRKVLSKCEQTSPPKQAWLADDVKTERIDLVEGLLDSNILLLSGDIEDYYPFEGGNKREAAIAFDPMDHSTEELLKNFCQLTSGDNDLEFFFDRVFE